MTQQVINIGANADDGTGDKLRPAFIKANANFTELYARMIAMAQRFVVTTPIVVQSTDQIISCRIPTAAACTLPAASSRSGVSLSFKDLGMATANNITLTALAGDTIDGAATRVISTNYGSVTLVPFNDGQNSGWMVL